MKRRWVVTLAYGREPDMATMDRWESQLGDDATISRIPGRGIELTIHVDGTTLDQALATARAGAARVLDDVDFVGVEITTEDEHLRRAEDFIDPRN
ncbi:MAG: hypothetical protein FGM52_14740 [Mycobacterium sp.]|nr:hypothetical protein [Mycobacterium sp.]